METTEKMRRSSNQILHGKRFLKEHQAELFELYRNPKFRSLMNEIESGQGESTVYPADTRSNYEFKAEALNQFFYKKSLYRNFPAYQVIIDRMVEHGERKISGAISVFYTMKYWECLEELKQSTVQYESEISDADYRQKWKQEYRCEDGHYVRSKNEQLVDNWLYHHGIVHAYEKLVIDKNTQREYLSDSYLPVQDVYIEIWGFESTEYLNRRDHKLSVYQSNGLKLINMTDRDVKVLDDFLSRQLQLLNR